MESKLKLTWNETSNGTQQPYRELIGCLMYGMLAGRPDLSASVGYFSRFQSNPTDDHWNYLKRVLRYIKDTLSIKLVYKRDPSNKLLVGFADADWGGDTNDRKSTSGYIFKVFNSTVSWSSRKQKTVSISSTESEFVSLCSAFCEGMWLKQLLCELGIKMNGSFEIYEDNQACIAIAQEPREHQRMKHIDIKYCFIRNQIQEEGVQIKYIPTEEQLADIMTKGLDRAKFLNLRDGINLIVEEGC